MRIWLGIGAATVVIEVMAILIVGQTVVLVAGIIGICVAAIVAKFQLELQDTDCKFLQKKKSRN